ncbi:protease modulator HflC [Desulfobacterales bacterium HSG16]|nr:protease modulator HflC [Desulfobacterales bacterium HSG16]
MKSSIISIVFVIGLGVGIVSFFLSAFIVDETELVVITQFQRIVGKPVTEPGLYFKIPFIQNARYLPKNLQQWDGDPGEIPTVAKKYIWVDTFARWKIVDAIKFLETVSTVESARLRLDEIIDPAVRNFITSNSLIEAVRSTDRKLDITEAGLEDLQKEQHSYEVKMGREKITQGILEQARPKLSPFGIELVDVKIKRINYVESVREKVYERMIAERRQIAEKFRSEGKGEASKIIGDKDRDLKKIFSESYRKAQEIKGEADALAAKIYAKAYNVDPDFYSFVRTLKIYREALDKDSQLVLSTDSEIFKFLKGNYKPAASNP